MSSLSEPERRDFWEICEDRYQVRSTILTQPSQFSRSEAGMPFVFSNRIPKVSTTF
jgi:hypothetical protein